MKLYLVFSCLSQVLDSEYRFRSPGTKPGVGADTPFIREACHCRSAVGSRSDLTRFSFD